LQVVTKGKTCAVRLVGENGKTFAVAPVRRDGPPAIEKVIDSSRYFCLRIENANGAVAFIGLGFNQRSDAFDFNVAIQDWMKEMDREEEAKNESNDPALDLSLKPGEKFTIKVKIDSSKGTKTTGGSGSSSSGLAAPPKLASPTSSKPGPTNSAPSLPKATSDWTTFD
jgi:adaptin ear-binding coat-associated protein 1/2